ncbi:MAG: helix-turn-helix transcriptional regulator [Betaproteobacteria bacterium HGW-Betaproteobacteria-10]|nr:MAG: helix-turn-helix transcriptional regulator [Betaproteobacteria bacterium HGW-Betaproteobacteria-10]
MSLPVDSYRHFKIRCRHFSSGNEADRAAYHSNRLSAIRKVAAGGKFIDPALVDKLIFNPDRKDARPQDSLSKRELQVLVLIAAGHPLSFIAERLNLSPKTVSTHKIRLMQKLDIDNNAALIRYSIKHELAFFDS